jgi:hypothetical protein
MDGQLAIWRVGHSRENHHLQQLASQKRKTASANR